MERYAGIPYDYPKAYTEFMGLYRFLVNKGLVYLLPSYGNFQDQTFVANLGCYLPHLEEDTILLSNFRSKPRQGEEWVGNEFFHRMNYSVIRPPTFFEGEADLKYFRDNIYLGGYGIRTDLQSYHWLMDKTGAKVVTIKMSDLKCYHFDCLFLQLSPTEAMVATQIISKADLRKIEKLVSIIPVPDEFLYDAWTNGVVIGKQVLHMSGGPGDGDQKFCEYLAKYGYDCQLIPLMEFEKNGAALSCMIMNLNYKYRFGENDSAKMLTR